MFISITAAIDCLTLYEEMCMNLCSEDFVYLKLFDERKSLAQNIIVDEFVKCKLNALTGKYILAYTCSSININM